MRYKMAFLLFLLLVLSTCVNSSLPDEKDFTSIPRKPILFPDYTDITIPNNISALNFRLEEEGEAFRVIFKGEDGKEFQIKARDKIIRITLGKWRRILEENSGSTLTVTVYRLNKAGWEVYSPFTIQVSNEPIDPYLVYRLIPPGYETWSGMGLYQRDLRTFKEKAIIENKYVEDNCVNCHSFSLGNSENMLFHIRGSVGGTIIKTEKGIEKVNLKTDETLSSGVYPSWHPSGDFIAFSTNKIEQYFHANPKQTIEVIDRHSDLIIYNTINKEISHVPGTKGDQYMETYPNWSPDGKYLYFSRSDADAVTPYDSVRYDIYRIGFDASKGKFGETELVFAASELERSASFPRISPDGQYLLCTIHNYGTFPIWHKEADLCMVNLASGKWEIPALLNSDNTDSYHSWAINTRWIVFSSRRYDGQYTKLYISYLDKDGQFMKAFLLPQQDPNFYDSFFYSYNRPELIGHSIHISHRELIKAVNNH